MALSRSTLFRIKQSCWMKLSFYLLIIGYVFVTGFVALRFCFEATKISEQHRRICYSSVMCLWLVSLISDPVSTWRKCLNNTIVAVIHLLCVWMYFSCPETWFRSESSKWMKSFFHLFVCHVFLNGFVALKSCFLKIKHTWITICYSFAISLQMVLL